LEGVLESVYGSVYGSFYESVYDNFVILSHKSVFLQQGHPKLWFRILMSIIWEQYGVYKWADWPRCSCLLVIPHNPCGPLCFRAGLSTPALQHHNRITSRSNRPLSYRPFMGSFCFIQSSFVHYRLSASYITFPVALHHNA
jgi:hypothetical protein